MNFIELQNISAYHGKTLALKKINLAVEIGQSHVILGPNGAGKSSLLKLMTRELYPLVDDESNLKIFGQTNINIWQLRKKIGLVSNDFQIQHGSIATGHEVVLSGFFGSIGIRGHHTITDDMYCSALSMLETLGVTDLKESRYLSLSTGQQRRLLLARALIHKPQVLILDEPTAGLDLEAKFWLLTKIRELCSAGITVIMVTHDPSEIVPEISHASLIKQGAIFKSGEKNKILTADNLSELFGLPINLFANEGYYQATPAKEHR